MVELLNCELRNRRLKVRILLGVLYATRTYVDQPPDSLPICTLSFNVQVGTNHSAVFSAVFTFTTITGVTMNVAGW